MWLNWNLIYLAEGAIGRWIFLSFQLLVTKSCTPSANCMSEEPPVFPAIAEGLLGQHFTHWVLEAQVWEH